MEHSHFGTLKRVARSLTATGLFNGLLRYLFAVIVVFAMSVAIPADALSDSRGVLVFLVIVGCAWFGGVGPGLVSLVLLVESFNIRNKGRLVILDWSAQDFKTMIVLAVVIAVVGWAGQMRRKSRAIALAKTEELRDLHRRKDDFLATLAHELRNPMAPLRSGLEVLRLSGIESRGASPNNIHDVLSMMNRQLEQLVHLIDDLLDVSRISNGKIELRRELVRLADVIRDAVETSRPHIVAAQHELSTTIQDESIVVDVDHTRIAQVITNLLNNAAKFTPSGGAHLAFRFGK